MRNSKKPQHDKSDIFRNKISSPEYGVNPLFWIGVAVLACLVFLTIITMLDLQRDSAPAVRGNTAAVGMPGNAPVRSTPGICPRCRKRGVPQCANCGQLMGWDFLRRIFICPGCRRAGRPFCPRCRVPMVQQTAVFQNNGPVQAAGFAGAPACVICPGCGSRVVISR